MLPSLGSLDGGGAELARRRGKKRVKQRPGYTTDHVSITPYPLAPLGCSGSHGCRGGKHLCSLPRLCWSRLNIIRLMGRSEAHVLLQDLGV